MQTPDSRFRRTAVAALAGAGLVVGSAFALSAVAGASDDDPSMATGDRIEVTDEDFASGAAVTGEAVELTPEEMAELDEAFAAFDRCLADNGVDISSAVAEPLPEGAVVVETGLIEIGGDAGADTLPDGAVLAQPVPEGAEIVDGGVLEDTLAQELADGAVLALPLPEDAEIIDGGVIDGAEMLEELPEPFRTCSDLLPGFDGVVAVAAIAPAE